MSTLRSLISQGLAPGFSIGRHTYGDPEVLWLGEPSVITVGSFCSIAKDVELILGSNHYHNNVSTYPFGEEWPSLFDPNGKMLCYSKGNIRIGSDVWIGKGAMILSGVTIGDGAVIGARAVVTKDVPAYGIVTGNPGTLVKYRFGSTTIERLLRLAWWEWSEEIIRERQGYLNGAVPIDAFLEMFEVPHTDTISLDPVP